jgi:hypothetical protein
MRVREAGLSPVCAEDVLVHHFGQASFGELVTTGEYSEIQTRNRAYFEGKWGVEWQPYQRRHDPLYQSVVEDVIHLAVGATAPGSSIVVVSKGDDAMLRIPERIGSHFPANRDGGYAGYYPADGDAAIIELQAAIAAGATHFLLPRPADWWLEHYHSLATFLADKCMLAAADGSGIIWELPPTATDRLMEIAR